MLPSNNTPLSGNFLEAREKGTTRNEANCFSQSLTSFLSPQQKVY